MNAESPEGEEHWLAEEPTVALESHPDVLRRLAAQYDALIKARTT